MPNNQPTKVITGKVRLSYTHLFTPRAMNDDQDPKYSALLLIPKTDKKTKAKIDRAIEAATEAGKARFGKAWGRRGVSTTLRDGDEEGDLESNPELAGHYFMNVSAKNKPYVVDRARDLITDPTEVYSGCYAYVSLGAFAYNVSGNQGVSFGLNGVQKVAEGEPLDGRSRAEDDFEVLDDEDDLDDEDLLS